MNEFFLFMAIGIGFLLLMLLWARKSSSVPTDERSLADAYEVLNIVQLDLPPRAIGERIFNEEDWGFIRESTSPEIQRKFLEDRKELALAWLRKTRLAVQRIMVFHRQVVRGNVRLSPSFEIRLAADYLLFLLTYKILCGVISVNGPMCAKRFVAFSVGIADQLSLMSGHILAGVESSRLNYIKSHWDSTPASG